MLASTQTPLGNTRLQPKRATLPPTASALLQKLGAAALPAVATVTDAPSEAGSLALADACGCYDQQLPEAAIAALLQFRSAGPGSYNQLCSALAWAVEAHAHLAAAAGCGSGVAAGEHVLASIHAVVASAGPLKACDEAPPELREFTDDAAVASLRASLCSGATAAAAAIQLNDPDHPSLPRVSACALALSASGDYDAAERLLSDWMESQQAQQAADSSSPSHGTNSDEQETEALQRMLLHVSTLRSRFGSTPTPTPAAAAPSTQLAAGKSAAAGTKGTKSPPAAAAKAGGKAAKGGGGASVGLPPPPRQGLFAQLQPLLTSSLIFTQLSLPQAKEAVATASAALTALWASPELASSSPFLAGCEDVAAYVGLLAVEVRQLDVARAAFQGCRRAIARCLRRGGAGISALEARRVAAAEALTMLLEARLELVEISVEDAAQELGLLRRCPCELATAIEAALVGPTGAALPAGVQSLLAGALSSWYRNSRGELLLPAEPNQQKLSSDRSTSTYPDTSAATAVRSAALAGSMGADGVAVAVLRKRGRAIKLASEAALLAGRSPISAEVLDYVTRGALQLAAPALAQAQSDGGSWGQDDATSSTLHAAGAEEQAALTRTVVALLTTLAKTLRSASAATCVSSALGAQVHRDAALCLLRQPGGREAALIHARAVLELNYTTSAAASTTAAAPCASPALPAQASAPSPSPSPSPSMALAAPNPLRKYDHEVAYAVLGLGGCPWISPTAPSPSSSGAVCDAMRLLFAAQQSLWRAEGASASTVLASTVGLLRPLMRDLLNISGTGHSSPQVDAATMGLRRLLLQTVVFVASLGAKLRYWDAVLPTISVLLHRPAWGMNETAAGESRDALLLMRAEGLLLAASAVKAVVSQWKQPGTDTAVKQAALLARVQQEARLAALEVKMDELHHATLSATPAGSGDAPNKGKSGAAAVAVPAPTTKKSPAIPSSHENTDTPTSPPPSAGGGGVVGPSTGPWWGCDSAAKGSPSTSAAPRFATAKQQLDGALTQDWRSLATVCPGTPSQVLVLKALHVALLQEAACVASSIGAQQLAIAAVHALVTLVPANGGMPMLQMAAPLPGLCAALEVVGAALASQCQGAVDSHRAAEGGVASGSSGAASLLLRCNVAASQLRLVAYHESMFNTVLGVPAGSHPYYSFAGAAHSEALKLESSAVCTLLRTALDGSAGVADGGEADAAWGRAGAAIQSVLAHPLESKEQHLEALRSSVEQALASPPGSWTIGATALRYKFQLLRLEAQALLLRELGTAAVVPAAAATTVAPPPEAGTALAANKQRPPQPGPAMPAVAKAPAKAVASCSADTFAVTTALVAQPPAAQTPAATSTGKPSTAPATAGARGMQSLQRLARLCCIAAASAHLSPGECGAALAQIDAALCSAVAAEGRAELDAALTAAALLASAPFADEGAPSVPGNAGGASQAGKKAAMPAAASAVKKDPAGKPGGGAAVVAPAVLLPPAAASRWLGYSFPCAAELAADAGGASLAVDTWLSSLWCDVAELSLRHLLAERQRFDGHGEHDAGGEQGLIAVRPQYQQALAFASQSSSLAEQLLARLDDTAHARLLVPGVIRDSNPKTASGPLQLASRRRLQFSDDEGSSSREFRLLLGRCEAVCGQVLTSRAPPSTLAGFDQSVRAVELLCTAVDCCAQVGDTTRVSALLPPLNLALQAVAPTATHTGTDAGLVQPLAKVMAGLSRLASTGGMPRLSHEDLGAVLQFTLRLCTRSNESSWTVAKDAEAVMEALLPAGKHECILPLILVCRKNAGADTSDALERLNDSFGPLALQRALTAIAHGVVTSRNSSDTAVHVAFQSAADALRDSPVELASILCEYAEVMLERPSVLRDAVRDTAGMAGQLLCSLVRPACSAVGAGTTAPRRGSLQPMGTRAVPAASSLGPLCGIPLLAEYELDAAGAAARAVKSRVAVRRSSIDASAARRNSLKRPDIALETAIAAATSADSAPLVGALHAGGHPRVVVSATELATAGRESREDAVHAATAVLAGSSAAAEAALAACLITSPARPASVGQRLTTTGGTLAATAALAASLTSTPRSLARRRRSTANSVTSVSSAVVGEFYAVPPALSAKELLCLLRLCTALARVALPPVERNACLRGVEHYGKLCLRALLQQAGAAADAAACREAPSGAGPDYVSAVDSAASVLASLPQAAVAASTLAEQQDECSGWASFASTVVRALAAPLEGKKATAVSGATPAAVGSTAPEVITEPGRGAGAETAETQARTFGTLVRALQSARPPLALEECVTPALPALAWSLGVLHDSCASASRSVPLLLLALALSSASKRSNPYLPTSLLLRLSTILEGSDGCAPAVAPASDNRCENPTLTAQCCALAMELHRPSPQLESVFDMPAALAQRAGVNVRLGAGVRSLSSKPPNGQHSMHDAWLDLAASLSACPRARASSDASNTPAKLHELTTLLLDGAQRHAEILGDQNALLRVGILRAGAQLRSGGEIQAGVLGDAPTHGAHAGAGSHGDAPPRLLAQLAAWHAVSSFTSGRVAEGLNALLAGVESIAPKPVEGAPLQASQVETQRCLETLHVATAVVRMQQCLVDRSSGLEWASSWRQIDQLFSGAESNLRGSSGGACSIELASALLHHAQCLLLGPVRSSPTDPVALSPKERHAAHSTARGLLQEGLDVMRELLGCMSTPCGRGADGTRGCDATVVAGRSAGAAAIIWPVCSSQAASAATGGVAERAVAALLPLLSPSRASSGLLPTIASSLLHVLYNTAMLVSQEALEQEAANIAALCANDPVQRYMRTCDALIEAERASDTASGSTAGDVHQLLAAAAQASATGSSLRLAAAVGAAESAALDVVAAAARVPSVAWPPGSRLEGEQGLPGSSLCALLRVVWSTCGAHGALEDLLKSAVTVVTPAVMALDAEAARDAAGSLGTKNTPGNKVPSGKGGAAKPAAVPAQKNAAAAVGGAASSKSAALAAADAPSAVDPVAHEHWWGQGIVCSSGAMGACDSHRGDDGAGAPNLEPLLHRFAERWRHSSSVLQMCRSVLQLHSVISSGVQAVMAAPSSPVQRAALQQLARLATQWQGTLYGSNTAVALCTWQTSGTSSAAAAVSAQREEPPCGAVGADCTAVASVVFEPPVDSLRRPAVSVSIPAPPAPAAPAVALLSAAGNTASAARSSPPGASAGVNPEMCVPLLLSPSQVLATLPPDVRILVLQVDEDWRSLYATVLARSSSNTDASTSECAAAPSSVPVVAAVETHHLSGEVREAMLALVARSRSIRALQEWRGLTKRAETDPGALVASPASAVGGGAAGAGLAAVCKNANIVGDMRARVPALFRDLSTASFKPLLDGAVVWLCASGELALLPLEKLPLLDGAGLVQRADSLQAIRRDAPSPLQQATPEDAGSKAGVAAPKQSKQQQAGTRAGGKS